MSYLSLLFASQTQGVVNVSGASREAEHEMFAGPNAGERAWTGAGDRPDDYQLPLGIASMEHWLDLNA
jgi:hypothetical protein